MAANPLDVVAELADEPVGAPSGIWMQAWRRLRQNRVAIASLVVIGAFSLLAVGGPYIAPYDPNEVHFADIMKPPSWVEGGTPSYLLGTDHLGRDIFSRLIVGARISMTVGLVPVFFYLLIGGTIGLIAGYAGGWVDAVLMRVVDVFYALPDLLVIITLVTMLRETVLGELLSGMVLILGALALFNWTGTARLVRGQVLVCKEMPFVEAARALGASRRQIVLRHIVPHVLAPVVVQMTFTIPAAIITESVLSFIGIGIRPPTASWGNMVQDGFGALLTQPTMALAPAACIALVTLAFTFLGDGLRDALDPQLPA